MRKIQEKKVKENGYDIRQFKANTVKNKRTITVNQANYERHDGKNIGANEIAKEYKQLMDKIHTKYDPQLYDIRTQITGHTYRYFTLKGLYSGNHFDEQKWTEMIEQYQALYDVGFNGKGFDFFIINWIIVPKFGGDSPTNDCLYQCLKQAVYLNSKSDKHFKMYICNQLAITEGVHYDKLKNVAERLHIQIRLSGDFHHVYGAENNTIVNLTLENGHYTLTENKHPIIKGNFRKAIKPLCMIDHKTKTYVVDGELHDYDENTNLKDDYYVVPMFKKHKSVIESYNKFIADCKEVETEIKMDMAKFGYDLPTISRHLFQQFTKHIEIEFDEIEEEEARWMKKCFNGGLVYAKKGTYDQLFGYDFRGQYGAILTSSQFQIPVRKGEAKILNELPNKLGYGIYRIKIESKNEEAKKLFSFNFENHYTHISVQSARMLMKKGFIDSIQLIQDGQANAYIYPEDALTKSTVIFDKYIDRIQKLKQAFPDNFVAKMLMSLIWGTLCKKVKETRKNIQDNEDVTGFDYEEIIPCKDGIKGLKLVKSEGIQYRYPLARMMAFLTSKARDKLVNILLSNLENVVSVQTDGFQLTEPIKKHKDYRFFSGELGSINEDVSKSGRFRIRCINGIDKIKTS